MAVYVDQLQPAAHAVGRHPAGTLWCHMFADTEAELHVIGDAIGMRRTWFQVKPGKLPHYDLQRRKREAAITAGAIEMPRDRAEWRAKLDELKVAWGITPRTKVVEVTSNLGLARAMLYFSEVLAKAEKLPDSIRESAVATAGLTAEELEEVFVFNPELAEECRGVLIDVIREAEKTEVE